MLVDELSDHVRESLYNRGHSDEQIDKMTEFELIDEFLTWNGFIGYTSMLINAIDGIRAAVAMEKGKVENG